MIAPIESGTEQKRVHSIVQSLRARLGEDFDTAVISAAVEAEFARFSAAKSQLSSFPISAGFAFCA